MKIPFFSQLGFSSSPKKMCLNVLKMGESEFVLSSRNFNTDINEYQVDLLVGMLKSLDQENGKPQSQLSKEDCFENFVDHCEAVLGKDLREIELIIPNQHTLTEIGQVTLSFRHRTVIHREHVEELLKKAQSEFSQKLGVEYLGNEVLGFIIDDDETILNQPFGLSTKTLTAKILHFYTRQESVLPFVQCCNNMGLQVIKFIPESLTVGRRVGSLIAGKSTNFALLDISSSQSYLSVFEKGRCVMFKTLSIGIEHFENDLTHALALERFEAKQIVKRYGLQNNGFSSAFATRTMTGREILIQWRDILQVLEPRARDLAAQISKILRPFKGQLISGVVLFGGGALLSGVCDFLSEHLRVSVRRLSHSELCPFPKGVNLRVHGIDKCTLDPATRYASSIASILRDFCADFSKEKIFDDGVGSAQVFTDQDRMISKDLI